MKVRSWTQAIAEYCWRARGERNPLELRFGAGGFGSYASQESSCRDSSAAPEPEPADDAEEDLLEGKFLAGFGKFARDRGDARAQLVEGAVGDEAPLMDDGDVAAQALDDFEHVRGEKDGGSAFGHALEHGFQGAGGDGVHAFEGLVEKQNAGAVDDGGGEGKLLLHAVGEVGDQLFGLVGEVHEVEEFVGAAVGGFAVEAVHAADEAEIFRRGEAAEEGEAFGDDADLALDVEGVGGEVDAKDARCGRKWERGGR